tara:strand:+ start:2584 stop:3519 length:936 start_codon:yes stop_codon:yes gene_type:complete
MERTQVDWPESIQILLNSPEVTDICINGNGNLYYDNGSGMTRSTNELELEIHSWIIQLLSLLGKSWNAQFPFVDLSIDNCLRVHIAFEPLASPGPLISIRKLSNFHKKIKINKKWINDPFYLFLKKQVINKKNILISGATGSGKTTLMKELIEEIPTEERIIALEDTAELSPHHNHFIRLLSRPSSVDGYGAVSLNQLLKQTLRMRPDRILLGECRGEEVLDLLQSLNTGHDGTIATIHSNSTQEAVQRIELLCLIAAKGAIPISVIKNLIGHGIHWIIQVSRSPEGRKINEVSSISWKENDIEIKRMITN